MDGIKRTVTERKANVWKEKKDKIENLKKCGKKRKERKNCWNFFFKLYNKRYDEKQKKWSKCSQPEFE